MNSNTRKEKIRNKHSYRLLFRRFCPLGKKPSSSKKTMTLKTLSSNNYNKFVGNRDVA